MTLREPIEQWRAFAWLEVLCTTNNDVVYILSCMQELVQWHESAVYLAGGGLRDGEGDGRKR